MEPKDETDRQALRDTEHMELYKWQKECLRAWEQNGCRGIVRAVTGSGKTKLALEAMGRLWAREPGLRVKVVVPTIPLAHQWQTALHHAADTEAQRPGFFGGGRHDDPDRSVMIYILNTARETLSAHMRRELALHRPCLLICDECHHLHAPQNRRIFAFLTPELEAEGLYHSLGLSATPFGTENDDALLRGLGQEIYRYDFAEAGEAGVIAPFLLGEVSVPFLPREKKAYDALSSELMAALAVLRRRHPVLQTLQGTAFLRRVSAIAQAAEMDPEEPAAAYLLKAWQRKQLSQRAEGRLSCAMSLLETLTPGDRTIVFSERIEQAEQLAARVRRRWGNCCGIYHSALTGEARQRNLRAFREGQVRILVSCRCLDEGIDVPDANVGIVLSGSSVERQRVQRLGRIVRAAPGKRAARLYYLYVRDSAEDAAFLPTQLGRERSFQLRYELWDQSFSDSLYEYAASALLRAARGRGDPEARCAELRRCLAEGLLRGDYLLPTAVLEAQEQSETDRHLRNYWKTMRRLHREFFSRNAAGEKN